MFESPGDVQFGEVVIEGDGALGGWLRLMVAADCTTGEGVSVT